METVPNGTYLQGGAGVRRVWPVWRPYCVVECMVVCGGARWIGARGESAVCLFASEPRCRCALAPWAIVHRVSRPGVAFFVIVCRAVHVTVASHRPPRRAGRGAADATRDRPGSRVPYCCRERARSRSETWWTGRAVRVEVESGGMLCL